MRRKIRGGLVGRREIVSGVVEIRVAMCPRFTFVLYRRESKKRAFNSVVVHIADLSAALLAVTLNWISILGNGCTEDIYPDLRSDI